MKYILIVLIFFLVLSCLGQMKFEGVKLQGIHTYYGPADISSLSNWWAPESPTVIDSTGTNTYRSWSDIKDGKNIEMTVKTSQPTQLSFTNTANGKIYPFLRFDGVNDAMTNNAVASLVTGNDIPCSGFIVVRPFDSGNIGIMNFASSAASGVSSNQFLHKPLQAGTSYRSTRVDNVGTTVNVSQTGATTNAFEFIGFSFSGTRITSSINGVLTDASLNSGQIDVDTFSIGSTFKAGVFAAAYNGDILEIALFGGSIGTNALDSLYRYYAKPKYNLP